MMNPNIILQNTDRTVAQALTENVSVISLTGNKKCSIYHRKASYDDQLPLITYADLSCSAIFHADNSLLGYQVTYRITICLDDESDKTAICNAVYNAMTEAGMMWIKNNTVTDSDCVYIAMDFQTYVYLNSFTGGNQMATIGLSNFYVSRQTTEETTTTPAVYETPWKLAGAIDVTVTPASNSAVLYGDNGPVETASGLGAIELSATVAGLELEQIGKLCGHTFSSQTNTLTKSNTDNQPFVCCMFEFLLSSGKKRCVKLMKGKASLIEESANTKTDSIEFGTQSLSFSFVTLKNNGMWEMIKDFDADASTDSWYEAVL